MKLIYIIKRKLIALIFAVPILALAQTDMDGIMMNKNQYCNGFVYDHSSWDHYWEGSFKRAIHYRSDIEVGNYAVQRATTGGAE